MSQPLQRELPAAGAAGRPVRAAFTLIEVLVVVAIVALLVAILLPSLAKAREHSQRMVCASQLKEFAGATLMYQVDQKDSLPGPLHGAMELETYQMAASNDYEQWHLPFVTRKYFTDKGRTGKFTDQVAKCPTAYRLSAKKLENTFGLASGLRPFTYALNNWNVKHSSQVDFGTDPPWYFGYPDYFWEDSSPPFRPRASPTPQTRDAAPKKISVVRQPSREWAFADAFRYTAETMPRLDTTTGKRDGQWRRGTYQLEWVHTNGREIIPKQPYHSGGINTAMFDGHVEWQRPWVGTVNPQ